MDGAPIPTPPEAARLPRLWRPRRVVLTRAALSWDHGRAIAERAAALGLPLTELPGDRLTLDLPSDPRRAYAEAKATLAVVVAPPSKRRSSPSRPAPTGAWTWPRAAPRIAATATSPAP
jgi:spore photoproduct lyase